jgi:hypothetical protein
MTSKKLGALLRSVPPATARVALLEPLQEVREPIQARETELRPASGPPRLEAEVPLQVLVPKHVRTKLGVMAASEGKSLRAVVLTAIRSLGIVVTDEEIRDKRGRRRT